MRDDRQRDTADATFETDVYFGWDGDTLHANSGPMGYRDHGAIVVCSDRGTVVYKDGRCAVWLKVLSRPWRASQVTCAVDDAGFHIGGDLGSLNLMFRGDALVNGHYDADGPTVPVEERAPAGVALAR